MSDDNKALLVKHWTTDQSVDLPLSISNITDDAENKWPAFTELLGIVLKYLKDTLKLSLAHVKVSDYTQLLQR